MKKKIKYFVGVLFVAFAIGAILINNKSVIDSKLIKDEINTYPVTIETAASKQISMLKNYIGKSEALNDVKIISETGGRVIEVYVENGDRVLKNQKICKVEDEILSANFKLAEAEFQKAGRDLDKYKELLKQGNISVNDFENFRIAFTQAEAQYVLARKYLDNAVIKSPINGILVKRFINTGVTLSPGVPVANVVDISAIKLKLAVSEKDLLNINMDSLVNVTSSLYEGKMFKGKIRSISVKANEAFNYEAEVIIHNSEMLLKAGSFLSAEFAGTRKSKSIYISRNALVGSIKDARVFIASNNKVTLRNITVGEIHDNYMQVLKGIEEGEQVVIGGKNNLEDGANITIKNSGKETD